MSTLKLSQKPKKLARFHSWKWNHISRHSGTSAKNKKSAGTPEYPVNPATFEVAACPFALEQSPAGVCSRDNDTPDSTAFLSSPASLSQACCSTGDTQTSLQLFHNGIPSASDVSREKNRLAPGDYSAVLVGDLSDDDVFLKEGDGGKMENGVANVITLNCFGSCSGIPDIKSLGTERVVFTGSSDDEIHSQTTLPTFTSPTFTLLPVDGEDRKCSNDKEMDKGDSAKQELPCRSGNSPSLTPFPPMRALSPPVLKLKSKFKMTSKCQRNSRAQTLCHSPRLSGYTTDLQGWRMVDKKRSRSFSATEIRNKGIPEGVCVCSCESVCESDVLVKHVEILTPSLDAPLTNSPLTTRVVATYSLKVCHHPQCTEENGELPLLLCRQCDTDIHRQPEFSGHLVLDAKSKRSPFRKQPSIIIETESEEDSEQDEDTVDGGKLFVKKPSKTNKRNVSPCEVERKLKRKKAVKKKSLSKNDLHIPHGLEAALAQIASPEGSDLMISFALSSEGEGREGTDGLRRNSMSDPICLSRRESFESSRQDFEPRPIVRTPIRRQSHDNFFTVKICIEADKEDVEVVAAVQNMNLRDALEPILERRGIEIATVNAFIEKSNTPLPMTSDTSFLVGNTLELKEKDERDVDMVTQASTTKTRPSSAPKGSTKSSKSSGRNSRRDSIGFVVPTLLEPPPSKQRRGSLQLPFREHFFNSKGDNSQAKSGEVRAQDEPFGSLRGRRGHNLSIDDTHTVPSTSPQGTLTFSEGKKIGKTQKLSVASLFANSSGKDREKHEQLQEILNGYSSEGLPPLPELLSIGRPKFDESSFQMEAHWNMLVENASALSKRQHDQQEAIWELLQTELSYIDRIKVIIDIFQTCLINVQQQSFLNEIETERLFSNIDEILLSNCKLWQDSLTKILEDARTHRHPLNPSLMKLAFTEEFQKLISPYTKYCKEQKQCVEYMKARHGDNELFRIFVVWAEAQKQCNRLKLTDLLVKPMQRLTKYSLLLQAILRKTDDDHQRRHVLEMIASVDKCVNSINSQMQQQHELERLEAIITKIEPYDGVEAPNDECVKIIQEYNNNFNLMAPMSGFNSSQTRHLLMHSSLRMKESQGRTDVDCFLFTDLILVCKVNRRMDKYKIIRPPMRLDQIVVSELRDKGSFLLIYTNEYHVPIAAYSFHGDPSAVRAWLESIRDAQSDYQRQRLEGQSRRASQAIAMKEEVEYAPLPGSGPLTMELHPAVYPHTSSVESTEGQFVPNISTALKHQSAIELSSPDKSLAGKYCMLPLEHAASCAEFTPDSVDTTCSQKNAPSLSSSSPFRDHRHKPVKASHSMPSMMGNQLKSVTLDYDEDFNGSNFSSDVLSADLALEPHSISHTNLAEPGPVDDDFSSKLNKINSRRVSRSEKRYYTADSIQELQQKDKDSSIYKRLSWQDAGHLDEKLRQKILSMESIPTSSGVNSSNPLHLNPEQDIREESELQKSGDSRTLYSLNDRQSSVTNNFSEVRCGQEDSTNPSDMIVLFHSLKTSEPENGISSVNLPALDERQKKLSPAQILKMKKQLLLTTADVEASEV